MAATRRESAGRVEGTMRFVFMVPRSGTHTQTMSSPDNAQAHFGSWQTVFVGRNALHTLERGNGQ